MSPPSPSSFLLSLTSRSLPAFTATVPLRLNSRERVLLTTLTSALTVSEYTDVVDIVSRRHKSQRIVDEILEAVSIAVGLGMCGAGGKERAGVDGEMRNAAKGEPEEAAELLQEVFEVGRRNKVLNPEKMRTTYGKLM